MLNQADCYLETAGQSSPESSSTNQRAVIPPWDAAKANPVLQCLLQVVEGLAQGLMVMESSDRVLYANPTALRLLHEHGWQVTNGLLVGTPEFGKAHWECAVRNACERQWRGMFELSPKFEAPLVSVTPICVNQITLALLSVGRTQMCGPLELQMFASRHGLSGAESQVLLKLCQGQKPALVARAHGVAPSTVVTQIKAIRNKTGCTSIGQLLQRLACLPPLRSALIEYATF